MRPAPAPAALAALAALLLAAAHPACAQATQAAPAADRLAGQVLDQATHRPLPYVSVGVLRQPFGTVADGQGRFALTPPPRYDADSVRFSLLGYVPRTLAVADCRRAVGVGAGAGPLLLRPQAVPLRRVRVQAPGLRRRVVGNAGRMLLQSYTYNSAGNQLAQLLPVARPAFLQEMSFRITHCSYDTVYFRLNVTKVQGGYPADNLLPRPLYLRISQEQALAGRIYVNLRPYKLYLTADVALSLELVRSLPAGTLVLLANWPGGGPSYELEQTPGPLDALNIPPPNVTEAHVRVEKQPDNGPWTKYPGVGLGFEATLLELPE